jgi:hypothetical protein
MAMVGTQIVVRGEHLSDKDVGDFLVIKDHWSGDGDSDSTIGTELAGLSGSVRAEVVRALAAESTLTSAISAEASTARAAESANAAAIVSEASTARAAESANAAAIVSEASTARAAEAANEVHIDKMVLLSGMVKDSEHLGTFTGSTISDSKDIKEAMQELETALEGEATTARAAEVANASAISAEATTARAAEVALGSRLDAMKAGNVNEKFTKVVLQDDAAPSSQYKMYVSSGELKFEAN